MNPNLHTWDNLFFLSHILCILSVCSPWKLSANNGSESSNRVQIFDNVMSICYFIYDHLNMIDLILCCINQAPQEKLFLNMTYSTQMCYTPAHRPVHSHDLSVDYNEKKQSGCELVFNELYRDYTATSLEEPVELPSITIELYTAKVYSSMVSLLCAVVTCFGNFHAEFMSRVLCSFNPHIPLPLFTPSSPLTCTQISNLMTLLWKAPRE